MVAYADASFLFSLYAQDANTMEASSIEGDLSAQLIITPLQRYELRNAFRLAVFRGDMTGEQCRTLLDSIDFDVRNETLAETSAPWVDVFARAEALSALHTPKLGIRALDLLHVATALALGVKDFFTFDTRQAALARKAGLAVRPLAKRR